MTFTERVANGIVLFDGAMGTMIHAFDPADSDYDGQLGCSEILNLTRPDMIQAIHEAYYKAGSDIVETNSFGSNEIVLAEYGMEKRAFEISRIAAEIARKAAQAWSTPEKPRFVAGSIGPGTKLITLGQTDWATMHHSYLEQVRGLLAGGVDLFLIETCQDLLQIKCALCACEDAMQEAGKRIPVIVTVTVETTGTLLVGTELAAVMTALEPYDIFALGMNCATGPSDMKPYVSQIAKTWKGSILVQPNAGLPQNVDGVLKYTLQAVDYAQSMKDFIVADGVNIVGGCCGTSPEFIAALANILPGLVPAKRSPLVEPAVSSIFSNQTLLQNPAPFFIGERTNTNGSKIFRDALLKDDWDGLLDIAREQVQTGAHALDVCVAFTGRDEQRDMTEALKRMVTQINLPLVIDSTEFPVLEKALQMYGGRAIINSINLEDGEDRADRICRLAKRYGAALIALTIDERGMARSVGDKLAVAKRIYQIAVDRHGMRAEDLLFDPLTFTIGSGDETLRDSARETMEGISCIKRELPGVMTVLGLSNVSFGLALPARRVLNSIFLEACVKAGLDAAIINLKHIVPVSEIAADEFQAAWDLLWNVEAGSTATHGQDHVRMHHGGFNALQGDERTRLDPLFAYLRLFEGKTGKTDNQSATADELLSITEQVSKKIIQGSKSKLSELLHKALEERSAILIINDILIPAMKVVGELFGSGKMQLPFVLQSAEVMKTAVDILEPFMEKVAGEEQLSIVLATVRGDVHDIGKNLVEIILSNNGYKVHNIGIKVEVDEMIRKVRETGASAIGMSGLLVKSTIIMKDNLETLTRANVKVPVLLGGAALTPGYVYDVCAPLAPDALMYCSDAFEGLKAMNLIKEGRLHEYLAQESQKRSQRAALQKPALQSESPPIVIQRDIAIPQAPFFGVKTVTNINLDTVFSYLTEEVLFRGRWGYRRGSMSKEEYEALLANTVRPEFEALKSRARNNQLLQPAVSYGYFACNSDGQDVIVYHPGKSTELARFTFPRQAHAPFQCIADYFQPVSSGIQDVIALQVATVGQKAQDECNRLYGANSYKDYLMFHGLAVECAEALAEYWHLVIRQELGITEEDGKGIQDFVIQKYRGSRYSFGYPACPDLAQNRLLCKLSESEKIGVTVSEEEQMVPEQTTSAFVVHHPQAKYFNA